MHSHANSTEVEHTDVIRKRQRLGVILLSVFSLAYAGFIGLCMFAFEWFSSTNVYGIPLTVGYGVALIVFSLLVALIYGAMSSSFERRAVANGRELGSP